MKLETLQGLIRQAGYTNSAADWENENFMFAFSREIAGPATYGHPMATASYNKETKSLSFPTPDGKVMWVTTE
jgi:hypothetical protein